MAIKGATIGRSAAASSQKAWLTFGEISHYDGAARSVGGTSIFDPVLCELLVRWFSPPGGLVIDPCAGGSVRGIVSAKLGRNYFGVDISQRQIEANREQALKICADGIMPLWECGDGRKIRSLMPAPEADFIITCPPYFDLEVYSDDPADLSNMPWDQFVGAYREIISESAAALRQDRFAAIVIGDVRDGHGNYRCLPWLTVQAFQDAGMQLYNEAVLVTSVGSLAIRVGKQFTSSRKMGKTHQNVLVFVKGDPKSATESCGAAEFAEESVEPEYGERLTNLPE